jgi:hypothetical protein
MTTNQAIRSSLAVALLALAGCAGYPMSPSTTQAPADAGAQASAKAPAAVARKVDLSGKTGTVTFSFTVPAAKGRKLSYVSAGSTGIQVLLGTEELFFEALSTTTPMTHVTYDGGTGKYTVSAPVPLPEALATTQDVTVKLFDNATTPAAEDLLSVGTKTVTVTEGEANTATPLTLEGVVDSVIVSADDEWATLDEPATRTISLEAFDAAGEPITGDYYEAVTLEIGSETAFTFVGGETTFDDDGDTIELAYDGTAFTGPLPLLAKVGTRTPTQTGDVINFNTVESVEVTGLAGDSTPTFTSRTSGSQGAATAVVHMTDGSTSSDVSWSLTGTSVGSIDSAGVLTLTGGGTLTTGAIFNLVATSTLVPAESGSLKAKIWHFGATVTDFAIGVETTTTLSVATPDGFAVTAFETTSIDNGWTRGIQTPFNRLINAATASATMTIVPADADGEGYWTDGTIGFTAH